MLRSTMAKKFQGNPPLDGVECDRMLGWVLFERPSTDPDDYRNYKLVSESPRSTKANYWLSYHRADKRFINNGDRAVLIEHQPELAEWVRVIIEHRALSEPLPEVQAMLKEDRTKKNSKLHVAGANGSDASSRPMVRESIQ